MDGTGHAATVGRERAPDFVPFSPSLIGDDEIAEVVDTLRSGWITSGPKVARFEERFAAYVDADAALALSSCTAAMHVALVTMGVGPGDAVITTPLTFCATIHVIEHVGAIPVLVDIDPVTLNLDANLAADATRALARGRPTSLPGAAAATAAGARPAALLPMHYGGHPCDMAALLAVARSHDLAVVEDAAHAVASSVDGRYVGSTTADDDVRRAACFSFYATKNLTTAEGGMLTGARNMVDDARIWSLHGISTDAWRRSQVHSWQYEVDRAGFKYNMTDIQAAIGIHQLARLDVFQARRRTIAGRYTAAFADVDEIQPPVEQPGYGHAWHLYAIRLHLDRLGIDRGRFIEELTDRGVGTSVHFIPAHLQPYYRERYGFVPADFPVASREFERLVSLPISPGLTDAQVDQVIDAVIDTARAFRR